ncbi:hypothetical protein [Streptomyces wuyuanensis]|uniref:Uncharacterized protein n=1 Tax=Streptomyces wuyuanensis TaxID=1196353 RepID=A0A1G9VDZ7_9ACTN|nr:hypothetical protein [Streptomyces wuyuanensis]SDM70267.1 hypothetical protein SAMN05444921_11252 [Streptomyces wuyuanensis]
MLPKIVSQTVPPISPRPWTALEAQLAPITGAGITARTEKMQADGTASIWFTNQFCPPWLDTVPSIRLARPDGEAPSRR